jgi:GNAT superfamily N-acetyltransferase
MLTIVEARTPEEIATARQLMTEYAAALRLKPCLQGFDEEMRTLPGRYAPPAGRIFLAYWDEQAAGVVALRPLGEAGACEMKRLFVRARFQGKSLGRRLVARLIREAEAMGYQRIKLDTMPGKMDQAIALYRELGFSEIAPYYSTPASELLFMELDLAHRNR